MTDQPSSHSEPSMEDILASIRRIIDDEDVKTVDRSDGAQAQSAPESSAWPPAQEQVSPYEINNDAAAEALAEYDSALAEPAPVQSNLAAEPNPEEETIFPERGGALWRRVAGHPLSEGETDPLPADDAYELTEAVDSADGNDLDELELNELLDDSADSDPEEDERVLAGLAGNLSEQPTTPAEDSTSSAIGIGAMTAAGVGAAGAFSGNAMDRIAERMSHVADDDADDDEVLDLTRRVGEDGDIEDLASAMSGNPRYDDDLPSPVFERVNVSTPTDYQPPETETTGDDERQLDRSFETVAVTGMSDDYAESLSDSDPDDAHERALDERFYTEDGYEENAPEIEGDYATSLGGEMSARMDELPESGAPTADELDTVGGLVRDALRNRLPAVPGDAEENPLVTGGAEESVSRSLATLARYDANAPRRIYGGIKITDDEDSPTIEGVVQDTLRPMLREWLNDNLPTLVESMVKQEVERISARSRRFVKDDED